MGRILFFVSIALIGSLAVADGHPYGGMRLAGTYDVDGIGRVTDATIWPESYPTQYHIRAVLDADQCLFAYTVPDDEAGLRYPMMDESLWIMPPLTAESVMTVGVQVATAQLYVAPTGTDADGFGGSADTPYGTLNYAVSKSSSAANAYTVIHAAAGDYASGSDATDGHTASRVLIDRAVRIKGAGRGESVIWGAKDTTSGTADDYGCGPDAVRCVRFATFGHACVQGFTLRDGRSGLSTDTADRKKGGIIGKAFKNTICDCLVTNCCGYNATVAYSASFVRSIVTCNDAIGNVTGISGGNSRSGARIICSIVRHRSDIGSTAVMDPACAYQSTLIGGHLGTSDNGAYPFRKGCLAHNCAIGCGNRSLGDSTCVEGDVLYCVLWEAGGMGDQYFVKNVRFSLSTGDKSPYLYRTDADDDRPATLSPVIGAGTVDADYYRTYSADVNGNPIDFVNGKPTVGAVQTYVQTLIVPPASITGGKATLTITGVANLTNAVDSGDVVTLTLSDMKRPGGSFVIGGETVQGPTHTIAIDDETPDPLSFTDVTFTSDWYVDAENGDDANGGFYPGAGFAKETLLGMLTNSLVLKGDTVHAAPGVYDKGSTLEGNAQNRCIVGEERTLVADEGPEKTIILGAAATTDPDAEGCGADAVRCVSMGKNAVLSGFTLTGGRLPTTPDTVTGGAALQPPLGTIMNCIITNNACNTEAGAVNGGTLVNCRIFDNRSGGSDGAAVRQSTLCGCLIDRNCAKYVAAECNFIYGCTIGSNNLNYAKTAAAFSLYYPGSENIVANSIVMGNYNTSKGREFNAYNSVFAYCYNSQVNPSIVNLYGNSLYTNAADIVLTDDYAPAAKDSFLVDRGDMSYHDDAKFGGRDANGAQRVYNGTVDIGAVEYDWRGDYTTGVVRKSIDAEITAASTNVTAVGRAVRLPPSGEITATWRISSGAVSERLDVTATVDGSGTLEIYLNGELAQTLSAGVGKARLQTLESTNELVFRYVGADGSALLRGLGFSSKGFCLFLR